MSIHPDEKSLRILQIHNEYREGLGGEDTVVRLEMEMLRKHGHEVAQLIVSTAELNEASPMRIVATGLSTPWSRRGYNLILQAIAKHSPDVVHVHNSFPILSPSIYWAAKSRRTPVVQTLHNYRLMCANGIISRDDAPCEECIGHLPLPALRHRCFKNSLLATAAVVTMQVTHGILGTFQTKVDAYIALTDFAKLKMAQGGLPIEKIHVKPNFLPPRVHTSRRKDSTIQFAFLGKIFRYKGLDLLLEAWSRLKNPNKRLVIVGEGTVRQDLQRQYPEDNQLVWLGWQNHQEAMEIIDQSDFLVIPSRVTENLPMVLIEGFSGGTPAIVPDHGAFPNLVSDENDGLLFHSRDVESLTNVLGRALRIDPPTWAQWSDRCRNKFAQLYTEETNYPLLMKIYRKAMATYSTPNEQSTNPSLNSLGAETGGQQ